MLAAAVFVTLIAPTLADGSVERVAFGSCADQDRPQPIWLPIVAENPDLFVFLGDNVYASSEPRLNKEEQYAKLAAIPGFRMLRSRMPVLAIWDDHDYGVNDGGVEYPNKEEAQRAFCDFFRVPEDSIRRTTPGIYDSVIYGEPGERVQFILLDTRTFRSPLKRKPEDDPRVGRYVPDDDPEKTLLGEAQWDWLEEQLREPAEVRIIASSIQVVPEDHLWEKWANLPDEREKLFDLIEETEAGGVIFLSGDRHLAEISMMDGGVGYPLYDITASALNNSRSGFRLQEPNRHRVGSMNFGNNFGLIEIDWDAEDPEIAMQILDEEGDVILQQKVRLSWLQPDFFE